LAVIIDIKSFIQKIGIAQIERDNAIL